MPSLVTYSLLDDGSIPSDILDGGYYPNGKTLIGVSSIEGAGFQSKEELKNYLDSYSSEWMESGPLIDSQPVPFDSNNATNILWEKQSL